VCSSDLDGLVIGVVVNPIGMTRAKFFELEWAMVEIKQWQWFFR
jgi:hypothetical protein